MFSIDSIINTDLSIAAFLAQRLKKTGTLPWLSIVVFELVF